MLGHLVIGGDEVSDNLTVLKQLNVKAVVNTTTEGGEMLGGEFMCMCVCVCACE